MYWGTPSKFEEFMFQLVWWTGTLVLVALVMTAPFLLYKAGAWVWLHAHEASALPLPR